MTWIGPMTWIVHYLVHDNSKELKEFLQVRPSRRLHPDTLALVAGPLKLATKYQADSLQNRIVSHLETDWPTTLDPWDDIAYAAVKPKPDPSNPDETFSQSSTDESDHRAIDSFHDPIPFISLARECDLPDILAAIFYSLCCDSRTRREKLSRMTRGDLETLMLGRERMMSFICGPAALELEINTWVQDSLGYGIFRDCTDKKCHIPVFKAWSDMLQDIIRHGDPLATFRTQVLTFRQV